MGYWVRGVTLYRSYLPRNGGTGATTDRWNGTEWQWWPDLLRMMLNGEPSLDELTEAEARARFPVAF